jgi:radical SAM protein with 4Fe4S-binding SPASM domain
MMNQPLYIDWCLTNSCDLACEHCVGMESGQLSEAEIMRVTAEVADLQPKWVILEGGEPLQSQEIYAVGQYLRDRGIDSYIITNGNAFTEEKLAKLTAFSPKMLFSIDGTDAATYEAIKRGASFDTAMEWAARCSEVGIFCGITVVLSRKNVGQIGEFIRLTERLGGERIFFLPLKPFCGDAGSNDYYREYALSGAEHDAAIREAYATDTKLEIFYDEPYLWSMAEKYGFPISQSDSGITIPELTGCAASHSLYIQTDGDIRVCMFSPSELSFGNVAKEPLAAIWERMQNSDVLSGWSDRKRRHGACASCQFFESCRGCLARTFLLTGDCTASDPCCPLNKDA